MIFVLENFVLVHPHPEDAAEHGHAHHIHFGLTAYVGISFHNLLDGLAISTFGTSSGAVRIAAKAAPSAS